MDKEKDLIKTEEPKNPELLSLSDRCNKLEELVKGLTESHNKMFDYLKNSSTQSDRNTKETKTTKTLKDFINEKENKK